MVITNFFTPEDFETILEDFGRLLIHVPVTNTISNVSGAEIVSEGTPAVIEAYFMRSSQAWDFEKAGFVEKGDCVCLSKYADTVEMDDFIYADGTNVTITAIDGDATTITVTAVGHGQSVGGEIIIVGTTNYNGLYTVATVPDADTLTITDATHDLDAETDGQINKGFIKFKIKESFNVTGIFDNTGGDTSFVYTANNLFLYEDG